VPPYLDPALALLWRAPDVLQVGLDPARAWALDGAPPCLPALLRRLDGVLPAGDVPAPTTGPADAEAFTRALLLLEQAGALRHGDPRQAWDQAWVEVVGDGPLAAAVRSLLDGVVGWCTGAAQPTAGRPDLVVLAPGHGRGLEHAEGLMARGVTHLWAHLRDGRAVVGPIVDPGRSPCLRCSDLHRTDADPAWPRLALAWEQSPPTPAPTPAATAAAALAVGQALRRLAGEPCAAIGATLEEQPDGSVLALPAPTHPRCGCGWAATVAGARPGAR
jgi:hypothetical protein